MKSYSSREIIKIIEEDGWYIVGVHGVPPLLQTSKQAGENNSTTS